MSRDQRRASRKYQCSNWANLSVALEGYIYAVGGDGAPNGETERYDPGTNSWTRLRDLGFKFRSGAVAALDGKIWACGGVGFPKDKCMTLDTSNNIWTTAAGIERDRWVIVNYSKSRRAHFITLSIVKPGSHRAISDKR